MKQQLAKHEKNKRAMYTQGQTGLTRKWWLGQEIQQRSKQEG